jgi:dTDP-glucose 4,6-dehydratase
VGPRGVYDEAKRYQEAITMAYHQTHGLDTRIARIFNTYGFRMRTDDGRVIPNFINNALQNEPLCIYGNGEQTRSFCYIDDTIEAIFRLLMSNYSLPVNIGNDFEITINDLATIIIEAAHAQSSIMFDTKRTDDPIQRKPDITLAKQVLDWTPQVNIQDGIELVLKNIECRFLGKH